MTNFLLWTLVIISLVVSIFNLVLFLVVFRVSFKNIDHLDEIDNALNLLNERKVDKQKIQHTSQNIPLEKM